ncbi:MAG: CYTH domain-containing protein [Gammaproteobacteria bacterium]|nr:CYTH domain-containing protein [Gammaproteobacteria bacterium]
MAIEIERKFLLKNDQWKQSADQGCFYKQGYLVGSKQASVRVRIEGDEAFLNIKSATLGIYRKEYEYPVPLDDANELLTDLCEQPLIEKTRYHVQHQGHDWEIDVFTGDNQGLVVAEIELETEESVFEKPDWLGEEVSEDPKYYNVSLVSHPYKDWKHD